MSMDLHEVQERIETYVREQFRVSDDDPRFDRNVDLYESGYVDSVGVVELLAFIGEEFGVDVPDSQLISEDFTNVNGIARIVCQLL
jgi:acyl carrier protein